MVIMIVCWMCFCLVFFLFKNFEIMDDMVYLVFGIVFKISGMLDYCIVIMDNQVKLFVVVIFDKDVLVLCGNGFGMFVGKRIVR